MMPQTPSPSPTQASDHYSVFSPDSSEDDSYVVASNLDQQFGPPLTASATTMPSSAMSNLLPFPALSQPSMPRPCSNSSSLPPGLSSRQRLDIILSRYKAAILACKYETALKKEHALHEKLYAAVRESRATLGALHVEWQRATAHREEAEMRSRSCEDAARIITQRTNENGCFPPVAASRPQGRAGGLSGFFDLLGDEFRTFSEIMNPDAPERLITNETELAQEKFQGHLKIGPWNINRDFGESARIRDHDDDEAEQNPLPTPPGSSTESYSSLCQDGKVSHLARPPYQPEFANLTITDRLDSHNQRRRCQVWAGDGTFPAASRCAVIEVPFAATLSQVSRILSPSACGAVINMSMFDMPFGSNNTVKVVFVEFATASGAAAFVQNTSSGQPPLLLADQGGHLHSIRAYLVPTPTSRSGASRESELLEKGATRRVVFTGFPRTGTWRFLTRVGVPLHRILLVEYEIPSSELTVEFASVIEAGRAVCPLDPADMDEHSFLSKMRYGSSFRFVNEPERAAASDSNDPLIIPYIPPHDLHTRFNHPPWNLQNQPHLPYRSSWPDIYAAAAQFGITAAEVFPFLDELEAEPHEGVTYSVVSSRDIKLTRRGGWYLPLEREDATKLLMASTLHDPRCREMWDAHFEERGVPNRRKYEEYGMIARERRGGQDDDEEGEEVGGSGGRKGRYMKDAGTPEAVRQFFSRRCGPEIKYVGQDTRGTAY